MSEKEYTTVTRMSVDIYACIFPDIFQTCTELSELLKCIVSMVTQLI